VSHTEPSPTLAWAARTHSAVTKLSAGATAEASPRLYLLVGSVLVGGNRGQERER
jgi:hypothetical protein